MRSLFIQFRKDAEMREQEYNNVLRFSGLSSDRLVSVDARNVSPSERLIADADAVVLGATGAESITVEASEFLSAWMRWLHIVRGRGLPMLGFNYGAHLMTLAFGGLVTQDHALKQVGSCLVMKEPAAQDDPLFGSFPDAFMVQTGHIDQIERIPPQAHTLLRTDLCPHECWAFPGEKLYALEFQVDLDMEAITQRLINYQDRFVSEPGELEHCILSLRPSPEAVKVLPSFFEHVVHAPTHTSVQS